MKKYFKQMGVCFIPRGKSNIKVVVSVKPNEKTYLMAPGKDFEQYEQLHRDFSKTYMKVYKHVMDFYPLPQKFIREAAPEIDNYVEKLSAGDASPEGGRSFQALFSFAKDFQAFASDANKVFEEYQELQSESGRYIKTVFKLNERHQSRNEGATEFASLIPVLTRLVGGFQRIEKKTEEAAKNLRQLQNEWRRLKANNIEDRGGTAWPI